MGGLDDFFPDFFQLMLKLFFFTHHLKPDFFFAKNGRSDFFLKKSPAW